MEKILTLEDKLLIVVCNLGVACIMAGSFLLGLTPFLGINVFRVSAAFCFLGTLFVLYSVFMDKSGTNMMRNKLPMVPAALGLLLAAAVIVWLVNQEAKNELQVLQQDLEETLIQVEEDLLWLLENKIEWLDSESVDYFIFDPGSKPVVWRTITFYEHASGKLFRSEHVIFGELVMKAYGIYNGEKSPQGHWIRVEKDGMWHTARTDKPEFNFIKDETETVIGIEMILRNENDEEVVRRVVDRK